MSTSVVRALIAKDLFLARWMLGAAIVSGLVSLWICTTSKMGFNLGSITFITTLIALGVMVAMYGVFEERKNRSYLFILSLPLSGRDYVKAKIIGGLLSFTIPWAVITAAALFTLLSSPIIPHGMAPFALLICMHSLVNTTLLIAATLLIKSEGLVAGCIVLTNVLVSVFLFTVASLPSINRNMGAQTAVWDDTVFTVLALQLIVICIAIVVPLSVYSRKRDLV